VEVAVVIENGCPRDQCVWADIEFPGLTLKTLFVEETTTTTSLA